VEFPRDGHRNSPGADSDVRPIHHLRVPPWHRWKPPTGSSNQGGTPNVVRGERDGSTRGLRPHELLSERGGAHRRRPPHRRHPGGRPGGRDARCGAVATGECRRQLRRQDRPVGRAVVGQDPRRCRPRPPRRHGLQRLGAHDSARGGPRQERLAAPDPSRLQALDQRTRALAAVGLRRRPARRRPLQRLVLRLAGLVALSGHHPLGRSHLAFGRGRARSDLARRRRRPDVPLDG
jgi:hypothetical protein